MIISATKRRPMADLIAEERAKMVCTRLQARLALGPELCAQIDAMANDDNVDWATRQMIQFATVWERTMPEIDQLGAALRLSAEEIDALFSKAMTK